MGDITQAATKTVGRVAKTVGRVAGESQRIVIDIIEAILAFMCYIPSRVNISDVVRAWFH